MTSEKTEIIRLNNIVNDVRQIIDNARENAVRSVDFCRVQMYWNIGQRIFVEEQCEKKRADYGSYLIKRLSEEILPEYGSGFSVRQLERSRQFYRMYPIASAVRSQLNWYQYRLLIAIILCKESDLEVIRYAMNRAMSPMMIMQYKEQLKVGGVIQRCLEEYCKFVNKEL